MYFSIRNGTDGIGLDFDFGVFADDIAGARVEAADALRRNGFALQADKGLFTVHGHPPMVGRKFSIIAIELDAFAQRIKDFTSNRQTLTSAEANMSEEIA